MVVWKNFLTRVATFEPLGGGPFAKVLGEERWLAASLGITTFMNWPFQDGRAPYTLMLGTMLGVLGVCFAARRYTPQLSRARAGDAWLPSPGT